jgi:adenosylhomocysteine nucleosidase
MPVYEGTLFDTPSLLRTSEAKTHAAEVSGALAADMESAAVGRAARATGAPFVVLRVILDSLGDILPTDIDRWIDSDGNRRPLAALGSITRPAEWVDLLRLSRRYRRANRTLRLAAQALVPRDFAYPHAGTPAG